jgi:hypothetical protein
MYRLDMIKFIVEDRIKNENINNTEIKISLVHELCSMEYTEVLKIYESTTHKLYSNTQTL